VVKDTIGADRRCEMTASLTQALSVIDAYASDAERLEREGVTRADIRALAKVGVLSAGVSGDTWTSAAVREIHERLAAASGALWFVITQHRSPAVAAASTSNEALRDKYAASLATGDLLGAVSFAHLRRPRPTVVAEQEPEGWRISGRLDWITGWSLADVLLLMAETLDGRVVQVLLDANVREGLTVLSELSLAAMQGTSTVGAVLDNVLVSDADVAHVVPKSEWLSTDAQRTANVPPSMVGLARAAINGLLDEGDKRAWADVVDLGSAWAERLHTERDRAYGLIDEVDPATSLAERRDLRASITKLAHDATSMLVAAQGGRAMLTSSSAQRWAREALFGLVQAQTMQTRTSLVAAYRDVLPDISSRS
jgi:alkylation response protein AidB-like acyl-CoA dehydrogenase